MDANTAKHRVNGSMLTKYHDKIVTLMCIAKQPADDGMSFKVECSDKRDITVRLPEPLQEYIEGLMEVQGKVDNRGDIECHSYVLFPKDQADRFDMESYDKAIQLAHQFPQHYYGQAVDQ